MSGEGPVVRHAPNYRSGHKDAGKLVEVVLAGILDKYPQAKIELRGNDILIWHYEKINGHRPIYGPNHDRTWVTQLGNDLNEAGYHPDTSTGMYYRIPRGRP